MRSNIATLIIAGQVLACASTPAPAATSLAPSGVQPASQPPKAEPQPPAAEPARVELVEPPQVRGEITAAQVTTQLESRMPAFLACYEEALREHPDLAGVLGLHVVARPDGSTTGAAVEPVDGILDERVHLLNCVAAAGSPLQFEAPASGITVIKWKLRLEPGAVSASPAASAAPPSAAPGTAPAIELDAERVELQGSLSKPQVLKAETAQRHTLQRCLDAQHARDPRTAQDFFVLLIVERTGTVAEVGIGTRDTAFAECITAAAKAWRLPAHCDEGTLTLRLDYRLDASRRPPEDAATPAPTFDLPGCS